VASLAVNLKSYGFAKNARLMTAQMEMGSKQLGLTHKAPDLTQIVQLLKATAAFSLKIHKLSFYQFLSRNEMRFESRLLFPQQFLLSFAPSPASRLLPLVLLLE
jgi:hypothetical protein